MIPFDNYNFDNKNILKFINKGKVRDLYEVKFENNQDDFMILMQSDRCSSFDYNICDIKNKGYYLTQIASYWFSKTSSIIDNHYISHKYNMMLVKKMRPIKLEFIARGYITGSCWRSYCKGNRTICGETLPEDLKENQKFDHKFPLITPTTKDEHDEPITLNEIIEQNYLTQGQLDFIVTKIKELYLFGYQKMLEKNIIIADTKYEFGFDEQNNIILIDEIHTPDSSRFWCKTSYEQCLETGDFSELEFYDKDIVRHYLTKQGFPKQTKTVPQIPEDVKDNLDAKYKYITQQLVFKNNSNKLTESMENFNSYYNSKNSNQTQNQSNDEQNSVTLEDLNYFNNQLLSKNNKLVIIVAGSRSDKNHTDKLLQKFQESDILCGVVFASAHKETQKVIDFIHDIENKFNCVIWVTMAGMSNALSGVFAANTKFPTIGCPVFETQNDMILNINSTLQMPSKVPVMTVLSHGNVVLSCQKIFNLVK